jgi:hypothetical protein
LGSLFHATTCGTVLEKWLNRGSLPRVMTRGDLPGTQGTVTRMLTRPTERGGGLRLRLDHFDPFDQVEDTRGYASVVRMNLIRRRLKQ